MFEISFYSSLFPALVLLPYVLMTVGVRPRKDLLGTLILYGFVGALLFLAQWGAVVLGVPIAIVALLLYTQPIWTTLFSRMVFNEAVTGKRVAAVSLATLGIVALVKPWETESLGSLLGIVVALCAGLLLSLWIILGKICERKGQHPVASTFAFYGLSAIWLLLLLPLGSHFITAQEIVRFAMPSLWMLALLMIAAIVTAVIATTLFYTGIQKAEAIVAGVILMLEPLSAAAIGTLFFGQHLGIETLIGGFLILAANYLLLHEQGSR